MSKIDEIKDRIDILDIVSETVNLRRSGKNYMGFCPFHDNKRTPAFVVFPDTGTWRCFSCNEGGDVFRFLMRKEGWDFPQALEYLAHKAGVELKPQTPQKMAEEETFERLRDLLEESVNFFRHNLLQNTAGHEALAYLNKRGLVHSTIETFDLGYAPDSWDAGLNYFQPKGYSIDDLMQVGLVSESQDGGRIYDRFRNRIMFPIRDSAGRITGFGARALTPDDLPKYLNSPQTELFDKGRTLYGLSLAKKAIREQKQAVIVEGYMDVILPYQAGYSNLVSPMGTALTEDQLRQLKRLTRRIVLALDADSAGEKATMRGLEIARGSLDRSGDPYFDARGLLRYEARLKTDLRVTTLPPDSDPADIVLRDPDEWGRLLEAAKPVVIHVMDLLASEHDLDDPKEKSAVAAQVLPLIEDIANPVERESYRQRLARMLKVDERSLISAQAAPPRSRRRVSRQKPQIGERAHDVSAESTAEKLSHDLEAHCLRLFFRKPDSIYLLNRALQKAALSRFASQDFENADYQVLARLVQKSLEQDKVDPRQYILGNSPASLQEVVEDLLSPMPSGEPTSEKLVEDLIRTVMRLRELQNTKGLNQLRFLYEELQEQGGEGIEGYQDMVLQYSQTKSRINKALDSSFQLDQ